MYTENQNLQNQDIFLFEKPQRRQMMLTLSTRFMSCRWNRIVLGDLEKDGGIEKWRDMDMRDES